MTKFTHKGWFGLCPVYIANTDGDAPELCARSDYLEWLFDLSEFFRGLAISCLSMMNEDYEPEWRIRITGELSTPIYK